MKAQANLAYSKRVLNAMTEIRGKAKNHEEIEVKSDKIMSASIKHNVSFYKLIKISKSLA